MGPGRRLRAPAGGVAGSRAELAAWLGRAARGAPLGRLEEAADGVCFLLVLDALTGGASSLLARANFRCRDADDRLRNLRLFDGALAASLPEGSPRRPSPDWELLALGNAREVLGLARWVRALALQNDPGGGRLSAYDGRARVREALRAQAGGGAGGAPGAVPPEEGGGWRASRGSCCAVSWSGWRRTSSCASGNSRAVWRALPPHARSGTGSGRAWRPWRAAASTRPGEAWARGSRVKCSRSCAGPWRSLAGPGRGADRKKKSRESSLPGLAPSATARSESKSI